MIVWSQAPSSRESSGCMASGQLSNAGVNAPTGDASNEQSAARKYGKERRSR